MPKKTNDKDALLNSPLSLMVTKETRAKLEARAAKEKRSLNYVCNEALSAHLK